MAEVVFQGVHMACTWSGQKLDSTEIEAAAADIKERALDLAYASALEDHMRDLAQTGLASQWLDEFFAASVQPAVLHWQVGEAIAETLLETDFDVVFPWNTRRDQRVPKASLPGADLVGLSTFNGVSVLVFGEVKSSADAACPPGVVEGKSGLVQQLERILQERAIQFDLIKWLSARIPDGQLSERFDDALSHFINSEGRAVRLVGALVRDTNPNELDVSDRAQRLGALAAAPGSVELLVWYLPIAMSDWPTLVAA